MSWQIKGWVKYDLQWASTANIKAKITLFYCLFLVPFLLEKHPLTYPLFTTHHIGIKLFIIDPLPSLANPTLPCWPDVLPFSFRCERFPHHSPLCSSSSMCRGSELMSLPASPIPHCWNEADFMSLFLPLEDFDCGIGSGRGGGFTGGLPLCNSPELEA